MREQHVQRKEEEIRGVAAPVRDRNGNGDLKKLNHTRRELHVGVVCIFEISPLEKSVKSFEASIFRFNRVREGEAAPANHQSESDLLHLRSW